MSIVELVKEITVYLMTKATEVFTGSITFTLKLHKGGISRVEISASHILEKNG